MESPRNKLLIRPDGRLVGRSHLSAPAKTQFSFGKEFRGHCKRQTERRALRFRHFVFETENPHQSMQHGILSLSLL